MNTFTYFLDLGLVNAFTLYKEFAKISDDYSLDDFKQDVCEGLVKPHLEQKNNKNDINEDDEMEDKHKEIQKNFQEFLQGDDEDDSSHANNSEDNINNDEMENSPTNTYIGDADCDNGNGDIDNDDDYILNQKKLVW